MRKQQTPLDRSGNALAIATLAAANCRLGETAAAQQQFSQALEAFEEPGLVTAQRLAQVRAWRAADRVECMHFQPVPELRFIANQAPGLARNAAAETP